MERKLRITVDGREYTVTVEDLTEDGGSLYPTAASMIMPAASAPMPSAPVASVAHGPSGPGDVVCPLGGVVDSIEVQVGQVVSEGDRVATLEAMKMKTPVIARRPGKVVSIAVKVGDAVHAGQTLLTLG
jgi:biotin carboxyl carrier protein